jgi:hypothetical protein
VSAATDAAHARFLRGDLGYPVETAKTMRQHLEDVATHVNRGKIRDAISACYAVTGVHDEFLSAVSGGDETGGAS